MAIIRIKEFLGEEKEVYSKIGYFATNFDGTCSMTMLDFASTGTREKGMQNGIPTPVQTEATEEQKAILDKINKLAYEYVKLQKENEGCIDA